MPAMPMAQAMMAAGEDAASYEDRGELFEYRVAQRVSLKRGASAMVPLLATRVSARKERIWRDGSPPPPDLVMTFDNDTGAVLEEGPAVVYDDNVYAGEAMVPYSARKVAVKLAFAKDLGVRCRRASTHHAVVSGVRLHETVLVEEQRREEHHELSAESDHAEEIEVIFELAKIYGRIVDDAHAMPFEETASFRRYKLKVPPRGKATAKVVERWHDQRSIQYQSLAAANLSEWFEGRFLDTRAFEVLSEVLAARDEAQRLDARQAQVEAHRNELYAKQSKISEQLGVLKEGGPEGALRLRYVKELEAAQDRVNSCEAEIQQLRDGADRARKRGVAALARITAK
jgi:hypothetical protein